MQAEGAENNDRPEPVTLMAAVIRLMAQCASCSDEAPIRTLLILPRQLRDHPELPRQPAVLASLATAHAIWVERLAVMGEALERKSRGGEGERSPQLH